MREFKSFFFDRLDSFTKEIVSTNSLINQSFNGPYRDPETEIRLIAHRITLLCNVYKYNDSSIEIFESIEYYCQKLISSKFNKGKGYFQCRESSLKDETNGTIGLAWVLEGLSAGYEITKDLEIKKTLHSILDNLSFDQDQSLWFKPTHKDDRKEIDFTFNHQLWLAYGIAFANDVLKTKKNIQVLHFLSNLDNILSIRNSGRIQQAITTRGVNGFIKKVKTSIKIIYRLRFTKYKEDGYHLFNLVAFARLHQLGYGELFVKEKWFSKCTKYALSKNLLNSLSQNKEQKDLYKLAQSSGLPFNRYGFPYNVSGLEFLYIVKVFNLKSSDLLQRYLQTQMICFKDNITEDKEILNHRIYEFTYSLPFIKKK